MGGRNDAIRFSRMSADGSFQGQLLETVFENEFRLDPFRVDPDRFPPSKTSLPRRARIRLKQYLWKALFQRSFERSAERVRMELSKYGDLLPRLDSLYGKLGDAQSREILLAVLSYRILGRERYAMPHNNAEYWRQRDHLRSHRASEREVPISFLNWKLSHFDLEPLGYPMTVFGRPPGMQHVFQLEQYRYNHSVDIKAEPGDYVIDAGACWGEVALYFAHRVGPSGRVFAFEFIPENKRVFEENLSLNPELRTRIDVVDHPVWKESGVTMYFTDNGPGSVVSMQSMPAAAGSVQSVSLSDFAKQRALPRVDFIKMDIEGAEIDALLGAEEILRRFRPKLAISVYHKPDHVVAIPEYLDSLKLGYRFYLDHFTTHMEETVLFATAR